MIDINKMSYQWETGGKPIIDIDSWAMDADSCFIYGASGCGKSSFVNLLSGISVAQTGEVSIFGENISALSSRQRDKFRSRNIGVIYQQFNLVPFLNGMDNILLSLRLSKSTVDNVSCRVHQLLDDLKLPVSVLRSKPSELSVGQQQRLAIVRTLVNKPRLILADEPTSALDAVSRDAFIEILLRESINNDCKVVLFSHDLSISDHFSKSVNFEQLNRASLGGAHVD